MLSELLLLWKALYMIHLQKLNGETILVNPDHIRFVEHCPDCIITFYDGKTLLVKGTSQQLEQKIIQFKKTVGPTWTYPLSLV